METEPEDLVDKLLKKSGCTELHYKVQACIGETRDWRKCQTEVKQFQTCMQEYSKKKQKN